MLNICIHYRPNSIGQGMAFDLFMEMRSGSSRLIELYTVPGLSFARGSP